MNGPLFATPLCFALAACTAVPPPAPPPSPPPRCAAEPRDPGLEVERLTALILDTTVPSARRADAVEQLACVAAMTRPSDGRVIAAVLTLAVSELILHGSGALEDSIVPEAKRPAVVSALRQAFCDPSAEVHDAARRGLRDQEIKLAAAVLEGTASCSSAPRAVAALGELEERAAKSVWVGAHSVVWSAFTMFASPLEEAAQSHDAAIAERARAAMASLGKMLDGQVATMATSTDPEMLAVSSLELKVPGLLPALRRATPALRARLSDRDRTMRLQAARLLVKIEAAPAESLVDALWAGLPMRAPPVDPASGTALRALLDKLGSGPVDFMGEHEILAELERLTRLGVAAAPALPPIRACLALPSTNVQMAAAAALAFVAEDRQALTVLRKGYEPFFADSPSAYGGPGGIGRSAPLAILYLDPDDAAARTALRLGPGPLLSALTRRLLVADGDEWALDLLLIRAHARGADR
jgi:hypothetical protein